MTNNRINVNADVWIRLTDKGRATLKANYERDMLPEMLARYPYTPPKESQGWVSMQLWVLAKEFGHVMGNGVDVPFETEMALTDPRTLVCSDCRCPTDENGNCERCRRAHT